MVITRFEIYWKVKSVKSSDELTGFKTGSDYHSDSVLGLKQLGRMKWAVIRNREE